MDSVWFAKLEDGRVYGPVGVAKLAAWAREGRLDSTSLISQDRVNWSPAPLKAALGMNWLVETEIGTRFGPFHREVIEELYRANQVPAGARLYRLAPRPLPAADGAPAPASAPAPEAGDAGKAKDEIADLRRRLDESEKACRQLEKEKASLVRENERLVRENGKLSKAKKGRGLGDLLFGKSEIDFAGLERAAQRELAAAKLRNAPKEPGFAPQDVIDIA